MTRAMLTLLMLFSLAACETAKGAGRDIQKAGRAIANTADDVQDAF